MVNKKQQNVINLIIGTIFLIFLTGLFAFITENIKRKQNNQTTLSPLQFFVFGGENIPSLKSILIGSAFGLFFGFIDNFALWLGLDALEPFLPGGELTRAALGNTYSDFLGSFVATYIARSVTNLTDEPEDPAPLWADAIGITLGTLIAIPLGRLLTGKN